MIESMELKEAKTFENLIP